MSALPELAIAPNASLPLNPALNARSVLGASPAGASFRNSWQSTLSLLDRDTIKMQSPALRTPVESSQTADGPPLDTKPDAQSADKIVAPSDLRPATPPSTTTPPKLPGTTAPSLAVSMRRSFSSQAVPDVSPSGAVQEASAPNAATNSKPEPAYSSKAHNSISKPKDEAAPITTSAASSVPVPEFSMSPQQTTSVVVPNTKSTPLSPTLAAAYARPQITPDARGNLQEQTPRKTAITENTENDHRSLARFNATGEESAEPPAPQSFFSKAPEKISANPRAAAPRVVAPGVNNESNANESRTTVAIGASAAVSSEVEKAGHLAERRDAAQVISLRPTHVANTAELALPWPHISPAPAADSAGNGPVLTRDFGVAHGTHAASAEPLTPPGPGARDTFATLDGDAGTSAAHWIRSGTHSAEAGFEDPTLGWIGVRADLNAGGVHAAIVPGSAEAAQALGSHMAGLHAYLSEQRTSVDTLTLAAPAGRAMHFSAGQDTGHETNQQMQQGSGQPRTASPPSTELRTGAPVQLSTNSGSNAQIVAPPRARAGSYISVMA
ncbi:MAG TPA: hypothetical protein VFB43_13695 [Terracidiphilus sp.]|nr:hypothetical protein [Terracidiphilus sp.]